MSDATDPIWALLERHLTQEGLELDDLELVGRGKGRVVRVTIDAREGVGLDRIAETSDTASRLLDGALEGPYTLEVTSPGLERKLRRAHQYRKAAGREVVVKTHQLVNGARVHQGVMGEADEDGFLISVEGADRRIEFSEVASARTLFRWERPPKPGRGAGKRTERHGL